MNELVSVIKGIAPGIASLLGGPLAGGAVELLGEKLLGNKSAQIPDIVASLKDPSIVVQLKQLDTKVALGNQNLQAIELQNEGKQIDVDIQEAKGNFFEAGARPALLWCGVFILINNEIILPYVHGIFPSVSPLSGGDIVPIVMGLLGFGGMHVYEKVKGTA